MKKFFEIKTKEEKEEVLKHIQTKITEAREQQNKNDLLFWQHASKYIQKNY